MPEIRILLADEHPGLRRSLRLLIERRPNLRVVAEAGNGIEAVDRAISEHADIAVVEIAIPRLNGLEVARRITQSSPATAVVMLGLHSDESYALAALRAGSRAYVLKECAAAELAPAIDSAMSGRIYVSPAIRRRLLEIAADIAGAGQENGQWRLTGTDQDILARLTHGWTEKPAE